MGESSLFSQEKKVVVNSRLVWKNLNLKQRNVMNIQLVNKTKHEKIDQAITIFKNNIEKYLSQVENLGPKNYFTYTEDKCDEVAQKYRAYLYSKAIVLITGYRSRWPWSRAIGSSNGKRIAVNTRKLNKFSAEYYAGFIAHEIAHMDELDYSHGNNYITHKKKFSVPYFIGYLVRGTKKICDLVEYNK